MNMRMKISIYRKCSRRALVATALTLVATFSVAQDHYARHRYDAPTTTQESQTIDDNDVQHAALRLMQSQPALVDMLQKEDSSHRAMLRLDAQSDLTHGDYLHYDGRHTTLAAITAGGVMPVKGVGTLFGQATYSRSTRRGAYQNYAVNPSDYAPYFVGDTISDGSIDYERYFISGGLSHTSGVWHYGVSGLYDGTAAAKDNQPRRSVYSYWFRVALNVAKSSPDYILSLKAYPEINKQSISTSYTVAACRYLQSYGLGQWNRKESTSGYSYGRDMKILGAGTEVLFRLLPKSASSWDMTALVGYNYRWMQTEETNFKNLYATKNNTLTHSLAAKKSLSADVDVHLLLQGTALWRAGEENVYESQRQDDTQSLYDYVKVGTNTLYHFTSFNESLQAKAVWKMSPKHSASILCGAQIDSYDESYDMPKLSVKNLTLTPKLSIGYAYNGAKSSIDVQLSASMRTALDNTYAAAQDPTNSIELSQTYIPYLLRGEDNIAVGFTAAYTHALKRGAVGVEIEGKYLNRRSAPYEQTFSSVYFNNQHEIRQLAVGLFYAF